MNIRLRRIDKSLPLPEYKTKEAAGFDLAARVTVVVPPREVQYIPLNVAIEPPEGYYVALVPRSSLHKRGLMQANGYGVGDRDFSGNGDEYTAALYNFAEHEVTVERGERIMQALISPVARVEISEVDDMGRKTRGGFGTTGA